jgi:hypothetical protein
VEPRQGIARARNLAVAHAHGDFLAFLDDDELPPARSGCSRYFSLAQMMSTECLARYCLCSRMERLRG